jgi:hypothetical protein
MDTALPKDDLILHTAFETIAKSDTISEHIREIATLVVSDELTRENIQSIVSKFGYTVQDIKNELLDMLIAYANAILEDSTITDKEKQNFGFLKLYFGIKPNDFYKYKLFEIKEILHRQLEKMYLDNNISKEEAEHGVDLQDMFELSFEQFDKLKEK